MIRTKNIQLRQIKEKSFKKYRNNIVNLIKRNRKSHYQKFSRENKGSSKAKWQGIHNIIHSKKSNRINTPSKDRFRGGCRVRAPSLFFAITCFFCKHFKELLTVLFEVELIIDSAPLTYVYPNTIETCLTSNHLLFGWQLLYSSNKT